LINPIRNLCSRNDELKRYLHLEGIALHALGDAGVDAGSLPLDTPLSALGGFTGVQGHARWAAEASGSAEPTIRDLAFVLGTFYDTTFKPSMLPSSCCTPCARRTMSFRTSCRATTSRCSPSKFL
jgi:hypothetical protein